MKAYGVNELRKMFLEFFESKGHLAMKSFSLVPKNDNSLLLINAGMAPLKPYFTGQEVPPRKRVTTCQKCIRTGDIDNVGKTARHGTFFEMLGNFSFGDYFKKEAIAWSWEFLTKTIGLDPERLYPSVYLDDDEAFEIWEKEIGIAPERIYRFGKEDNFWEHGAGPCGPCSEIYYDRGEKYGCGKPDCTVGCDCDRYMEVWNNVFTQFENDGQGNYTELENKNIDTGMGLERLAVVVQDVNSIFDVDTVKAIRDKICEVADVIYGKDYDTDVSVRVITDHIRSATFMLSDGITPSNEGRGYVLRRLIRRAARHGRLLGIDGMFLTKISEVVIHESKDGYPELEEKQEFIFNHLSQEEKQFNKTIDQGLSILADMEKDMEKEGTKQLSGKDAFRLYDTYGFPLDLTIEILDEKGFTVDQDGFEKEMEKQRETARKARKTTNYMGADATVYEQLDPAMTSEFLGYDALTCDGTITAMTTETEVVDELSKGMQGTIIADQSVFYATSGGQEADRGVILSGDASFEVKDVVKLSGGKIGHVGSVVDGTFHLGDQAVFHVDERNRRLAQKNHSATHLLQKALREVLGTHVEQAGSLNNADHLRFDFTHFSPMSEEEIRKVEEIVNEKIAQDLPVNTQIMSIEDAKKTGAMALFGEKYGDEVRVVSMGDFSVELCGGTHVKNTGTITAFKILSETGIASGVRRIEAVTDQGVFRYYHQVEDELKEAAAMLKATPSGMMKRIETLLAEVKELKSENESLKSKLAKDALGDVMDQITEVNGVKVLATAVEDVDMNGLRELGDDLKAKMGEGVIVLASSKGGKVFLVAMVTDEAKKAGAHAGNLLKEIAGCVGGGGGGRPNMAQAGGKDPSGIPNAIEKSKEVLKNQIS